MNEHTDALLLERVVLFAMRAHEGQKRKHDDTPYIVHPLFVALLLRKYGFPDEVVAAGLLHDVLEDTPVRREEVLELAGEETLRIVDAVSEDKTLSWKDRKEHYIQSVRSGDESIKAVSLADKLHNLRNLQRIYTQKGDEVWASFGGGKEGQRWFFTSYLSMMEETWSHPLIDEYRGVLESMFSN